MKIANTLSTILLSLVLLALVSETAQASFDDYQRFRRGTYDFEVETQYFKSDANYVSSGNSFQSLILGQSFEIYNVYLKTRYDLSRRSSLYGNLNIANATSHGFDATRTNSSVSDVRLGYSYRWYNEDFDVITEFNTVIPFYKTGENTDSAINGENVLEGTGLLRLQKDLAPLRLYGYLGGTYRQSRSALVPWGAGMEFHFPRWSLGGKLFGYQSITDDPDTGDTTLRTIVVNRVNASSLKFYSVNPSLIDSEAYAKIKLTPTWTLSGAAGMTVSGANTAAGFHAGVALSYTWDSEPSYYLKNSTQEDGLGSERKVPKFKEEINDGVDQNLFQKKITPQRPSSDINAAPDYVEMKRVGPRPTSTPLMKETGGDMQIKLKKKKKRRS